MKDFEDHINEVLNITATNLSHIYSDKPITQMPALSVVTEAYDADFLEHFVKDFQRMFLWSGELLL